MKKTDDTLDTIRELSVEELCKLADSIWDEPELGFDENCTSNKHKEFLIRYGFTVDRADCGIDTAYIAKWGKGAPVIAFLAEMDALPDMSQEADEVTCRPRADCRDGHGCGHNLLGPGAIAAAIIYKTELEKTGTSGTVLVIGCPGEENGSGKSIMAKKGVFDGIDVALTWHPSIYNLVCSGSNQSYIQASYHFTGISSHAAVAPENGRSALEAIELMNAGIARLRSHLTREQNVSYAITDSGSTEPSIISANTEETCLIRAASPSACEHLYKWVNDIAQGAALMTGTQVKVKFQESAASIVPNLVLETTLKKAFRGVQPPEYTREEIEYFEKYRSLSDPMLTASMLPPNLPDKSDLLENIKKSPVCDHFIETKFSLETYQGSSDVGDVSQICPTGVINTACFSFGTFPHSWMWVAQGKSSGAHKGMLYAAEVLAAAAKMIADDSELVKEIRAEWNERKRIYE